MNIICSSFLSDILALVSINDSCIQADSAKTICNQKDKFAIHENPNSRVCVVGEGVQLHDNSVFCKIFCIEVSLIKMLPPPRPNTTCLPPCLYYKNFTWWVSVNTKFTRWHYHTVNFKLMSKQGRHSCIVYN